ncbi:hypothetical protein Ancab_027330 [Ancistrocladus abbreviatus]
MTAAQSPSPPPPPPPPPSPPIPELPTESTIQRYKTAWRVFMIANLGLGAYLFIRAKQKDLGVKGSKPPREAPSSPSTPSAPPVVIDEEPEIAPSPAAIIEPVKVLEPIPEDQQRELFKWMLEEKRKLRPKYREEKKQIDEEKSILKQFIRAKSIPHL